MVYFAPYKIRHSGPPWRSDLGGKRPRMVEGRIMQEQLSRAKHDYMDLGGRVMHGAITESARADNNN